MGSLLFALGCQPASSLLWHRHRSQSAPLLTFPAQALYTLPRQLGHLEELVASISAKASARITQPIRRLEAATSGTQLLLLRAPSLQPEPLPVSRYPHEGSGSGPAGQPRAGG